MTTLFDIIKMLAVCMSAGGAYFVALNDRKKRLVGFFIWIFANIIWTIDSIQMANYTQTALWIYYNLMCLVGIKNNLK
jgi:hypothetical protein